MNYSFEYANGALFSSWESGNAVSYGYTHSNFGHLSDFIVMGGSGGGGNVEEPTIYGVFRESASYPAYAMGYSAVDAVYQGINYIAWQNDVIGDPLEIIAWGKQTLNQNTTWSGTNLVTGKIIVPTSKTLTITGDGVINFKYLGSLEINGTLIIEPGAILNLGNGKSFVFNNTITVPSGAILNISAGTSLNFNNDCSLIINGTLNAEGTSTEKVTFTSQSGLTYGSWGSIIFDGTLSSNSTLDNVEIKNASDIQCLNGANITIQNSLIEDCIQGIYI